MKKNNKLDYICKNLNGEEKQKVFGYISANKNGIGELSVISGFFAINCLLTSGTNKILGSVVFLIIQIIFLWCWNHLEKKELDGIRKYTIKIGKENK